MCIFPKKKCNRGAPETLFGSHVRRFSTSKVSRVKRHWRVHFFCKSNEIIGAYTRIQGFKNGYLEFSKFWFFHFKILINDFFLNIYKSRNFDIITKLSTRPRDNIPLFRCTQLKVDILMSFWVIIKKLKNCRKFYCKKTFFANISGTMARSGTRIIALYFRSEPLSKSHAKILDRSILTSSVTPGWVIQGHQEFF